MDRNMTSQPLFQNIFILGRPGVAILLTALKLWPRLLKKLLKTQGKFRKLQVMYQNPIYISIPWYSKTCWFLAKKCWCSENSRDVSHDLHIFWIFHRYGITVSSFIIVGYAWQVSGRGTFPPSRPTLPDLWAVPKKPMLNRVKKQLPEVYCRKRHPVSRALVWL